MSAVILFPVFLLVSCATTTFTPYRGPDIVKGDGGTVRVFEGVDFWENGTPDRNYRMLGVIDDRRGDGRISRSARDSDIAAKAKEYGGDAVILVNTDAHPSGVDNYGNINYKVLSKLIVVKYLE